MGHCRRVSEIRSRFAKSQR